MKQQDSAFVCFSGGQDSTTCLFWAKKHFSHVEAVCFTYGQKHSLEVKVAQKIAEDAQVPFHLLDVSLISQLDPNCSLVNDQIPMNEAKPADSYPNTFVPGRNMVFLTFAAILARRAFSRCAALTCVRLEGTETLGARAFAKCPALREVTIARHIPHVGRKVFAGCGCIERVILPRSMRPQMARLFGRLAKLRIEFIYAD